MPMNCGLQKLPLIVSTKCKPLTDKIANYYNAGNCFPWGFNTCFMGFLIPLHVGIHLASKTSRCAAASLLLMNILIGVSYSSWVLLCFLRKFKWSFPPWNKCTHRKIVYFLEVFHWIECVCWRAYAKKKEKRGGKMEASGVQIFYIKTLSIMSRYNLKLLIVFVTTFLQKCYPVLPG